MVPAKDQHDPNPTVRLLGLAFAGADLVFEVTNKSEITFALGAAERLTGFSDTALVGKRWQELVADDDSDLLTALLNGLQAGERQGPLRVTLKSQNPNLPSKFGSLSVFRLPQLGDRVSCALSLGAPGGMDQVGSQSGAMMSTDDFSKAATQMLAEADRAGLGLRLDLIEMTGLQASLAQLPPEAAEKARQRMAATLRADSYAGLGGAEISQDRFALVRPMSSSNQRLEERLGQATGVDVKPTTTKLALTAGSVSQNMRAMRYALDRYLEDGPVAAAKGFTATVEQTVRDTTRFKSILADSAFQLAYQPVVSLQDTSLHHFEALARFEANVSPADTIRLAEELELISEFDFAVVRGVAKALMTATKGTKIAANISGHSLMLPQFFDNLLGVLALTPSLRPRMLLEITETRLIDDLDRANQLIGKLRAAGHVVCLDDFGAGAASLDYLRKLDVDFVKIDGRYIQTMEAGSKDATIVKHVVQMCAELGMQTIAEMIETQETADLVKSLGVNLGQGWVYAKALPTPVWEPSSSSSTRRRSGSREEWG